MKSKSLLLAALAALPCAVSAAPIAVTGTMTHSENFDSLGAGSPAWADDSTLPGWYVQINNGVTIPATAQAADGSAVLDGLLNCGTLDATDRALGSKATGTGNFANIACAVSFQNNSANPIQFSGLTYTGECWRTNSTAAGLAEVFTVFYQISAAPVTNIISGANNATAAAGAGFTALGTGANWTSPVLTPVATAMDGNLAANRATVTFTPATSLLLQPGQHLMIKWTDTNLGGTDGFQAIDDVSVSFTQLDGSVAAEASLRTRDFNGTPENLADDSFGFTALISGSGAVSTWQTADVQPPFTNTNAGSYGTPVVWTGFPLTAPKTVAITDAGNPAFSAALTVPPLLVIGSNDLVLTGTPIVHDEGIVTGWTINDGARTMTQSNPGSQTDFVINSEILDLSGTGFVLFKADLDAIAGTDIQAANTSGFEAADHFRLDLIIDGGAPVSVLGTADTDGDGQLEGAAAGAGTELPDAGQALVNTPKVVKPFTFSRLVPETANSLQFRITGSSNSSNETFVVKNVKLTAPPGTVLATVAGPTVMDNRGTVDAADDQFSAPVNVVPVNLPASPGWRSDATPDVGPYSPPAVTFGPFLVSGGSRNIRLQDQNDSFATTNITIPAPPTPSLSVTAPLNLTRVDNGPGAADDTVTFQATVTGTSNGPFWSAAGANPPSGIYSAAAPVTFTIPAPLPASPHAVVLTDVSYASATQTLSIAIPARYILGQKDFGAGLSDVETSLALPPPAQYINDPVLRTLEVNNAGTPEKVLESEVIDLTGTGAVLFTARLRATDSSTGSNFETPDKFKAELIYEIGGGPTTINLITPWDTGDGAPTTTGTGLNGPPDGYLNGYQGAAGTNVVTSDVYATVAEDYNANRSRDEFNGNRQTVDASLDATFNLSAIIPADADNVRLRLAVITVGGATPSERVYLSDVLFVPAPPTTDNDGDGVSNTDEATMGTDPENPNDVLRLTLNPVDPSQVTFPTVALRYYRVYQSDDTDGQEGTHLQVWQDAGLPTIEGNGNPGSFNITISPGEPRRYYRLHVMTSDGPWP